MMQGPFDNQIIQQRLQGQHVCKGEVIHLTGAEGLGFKVKFPNLLSENL